MRPYLLLSLIELDLLREKDDKKRNTDHATEAHDDSQSPAKVCPRVEVSVANGCHRHEAEPQWIHKVAVVLGFKGC